MSSSIGGYEHSSKFNTIFITTGAQSNIIEGDLIRDANGYIITNKFLQVINTDNVFASGDCISFNNWPLPKAGVFAVRQGPVLAHNIQAFINKSSLQEYIPQNKYLKILLIGKEKAIAVRGNKSLKGYLSWKLKEFIDRKFMRQL